MFQYRLKRERRPLPTLEEKADYLAQWRDELSKGQARYEVTQTLGYQDAYEYFESYVNDCIRRKEVNLDEIAGIQRVFDWFEGGEVQAQAAAEALTKWENEPE